jgi:pSer/pThr/pTyr-binding forkhead associated (FHA) protein
MAILIIDSAESGKATHELAEEVITIGRSPENVIRINDPSVSNRHAQLQLVGENYRLKDLGSTNGTRVNGLTVTEAQLRLGDRLRFGKAEARLESDVTGGSQPLPETKEIAAKPASSSERPADFSNASPFTKRTRKQDPMGKAILAAAAIAILAFLLSMIGLLQMQAPPIP